MLEKKQQQLFEYANDIINTLRESLIVLDSDLRVVTASASFYKFFKVEPEDTLGRLIYDLGKKQWDIPKLRELLETILPKKTKFDDYEVQHDFARIGRRTMLLNARQIKQASGEEKIILLSMEDVTERKEIEHRLEVHKIELEAQNEELTAVRDKLSASREKYFNFYNLAPVGYLTIDKEGFLTEVSLTSSIMLGFEKSSMVNKKFSSFISFENQNTYYLYRKKILNSGETQSCEIRISRKDDTSIWINLVGQLLDDGFISIVISDITERKKMEKELYLKEEMMLTQSKQAAMGEMIAMIAHQWRQPLSTIGMSVNNVKVSLELDDEVSNEDLRICTNAVSKQIRQLSKTIDDFRNFFKPDQSKEQITIEDALDDTFNIIGTSLANNNIALTIQNASKSSLFIGKSSLIQVLLNIIGNAKDALLSKQPIDPAIKIIVSETKEAISISICDNAGGIPESIIDKIDQPYFTTKQELNGTGLGLYISHTIIKEHLGGTLSWHNKDRGSCFVITLNMKNNI